MRQKIVMLLQDAVAAHQRGELRVARRGYESALELSPDQPDALHLLGVIADQEGRHEEAVALIRRAIARKPAVAEFHGNLGNALLALGRADDAEAAYRQAVQIDRRYADGLANLGSILSRREQFDDAQRYYQQALTANPDHATAHGGLGALLLQRRQVGDALPHLVAAVRLNPGSAATRDVLATALRHAGRLNDAVLQHRKAVALDPSAARYHENFALTLMAVDTPKSFADAANEYRAVLGADPDRVESLSALGALYVRMQKPADALPVLDRARRLAPKRFEVMVNHIAALSLVGRIDEALAESDALVAEYPDDCVALNHRGTTREHAGDYTGALADYELALRATKNRNADILAETEFKRVLLMLSLGRLAEAWPQYTARLSVRNADPRGSAFSTRLPPWDGIVRHGQRILVWGEQGVGDQILYGSMLADLLKTGADVRFACDPRLVPLFRRSVDGLRVEGATLPVDNDEIGRLVADADVQTGLGDLGAWFRPTLKDFPPPRAYLKPDPARTAELRRRYVAHGKSHIVGITWRSTNRRLGNLKSIPLADWAPVLKQDDTLFVDMQYGDTAEERAEVKARLGVDILHDDTVDAMQDLDGYAAQAAALDMMVGSSNSGIHIAAATGLPCWVLVPSGLGRLWYWHLGRSDSPWYPAVRLFHQPAGGADDWRATIAELAAAMRIRLQDGGS